MRFIKLKDPQPEAIYRPQDGKYRGHPNLHGHLAMNNMQEQNIAVTSSDSLPVLPAANPPFRVPEGVSPPQPVPTTTVVVVAG